MHEHLHSMNRYESHRPPVGRILHFAIPLAIGFMLGMRKGMLHHRMGANNRWGNGVPPFFAELHRRAHEATDQPEVKEA